MTDCRPELVAPIRGKQALAGLMQHRKPMLLIDSVLEYTDESLLAEVNIGSGSAFFDIEAGAVPAWVGVEYLAQSIAALNGLRRRQLGASVDLGMLISARRVSFSQAYFPEGGVLHVRIHEVAGGDTGMAAYRCMISDGRTGVLLAEGQLGVFSASA